MASDLGIGLLVCLLFIPVIGILSGVFPDNKVFALLGEYAWITIAYVTTGSIKSTCALFVRSAGHVKLYAVDGILTTAMNIVFNVILLFGFKLGNIGYLLSVILADICSITFLWFTAKLWKFVIFKGIEKSFVKSMMSFCLPMIPTSVMWWIINSSGSFFVTSYISFDASGIYKAAYKFPSMISIFSGIFSQAWNMSAITENNSSTVASFYTNVFNIFQSFVYVIAAGLMLVIRIAIQMFCEPEFYDAYRYTPFLILSVSFTCFSTFMGSVYVASKKSMRSMATAAIGAVVNIILNIVLIKAMGLHGAALAAFISFLVIFIIRAADTRKIVKMDMKLPKMIVNSVLLIGMSFVVFLTESIILYYALLAVFFILITAINFKSGLKAVKIILKKEKFE